MRRHKGVKATHKQHKAPFKGLDNTQDLDSILGRTKIYQDVLGITSEELSTLYEQASEFLQMNRLEEAKSAFLFLTKINPFASDFWIGLGVCHLQNEEFKDAFNAFIMALTMDPGSYECFAYAIECCIQMKNPAQAEALLKQAITYARRHPSREESRKILEEAIRIAKEIASLKR